MYRSTCGSSRPPREARSTCPRDRVRQRVSDITRSSSPRHPGTHVIGVCAGDKADFVRSLGADKVIDTTTDFTADHGAYDLIVDIVGTSSLRRLCRCLTRGGTLVIVGGPGRWTGVGRQIRAVIMSMFVPRPLTMFVSVPRQDDLEQLRRLVAAGDLTPVVAVTYP